jgi:hypothetical protein
MRRDFWRDLYPISETRRRFARATAIWIYLPIGTGALIALAAAAALIVGSAGSSLSSWAQIATILFTVLMIVAGFAICLLLLAAIGGLELLLETLPFFSSRVRLRVVTGARAIRRGLNGIRGSVAFLDGIFFSGGKVASDVWRKMGGRNHG